MNDRSENERWARAELENTEEAPFPRRSANVSASRKERWLSLDGGYPWEDLYNIYEEKRNTPAEWGPIRVEERQLASPIGIISVRDLCTAFWTLSSSLLASFRCRTKGPPCYDSRWASNRTNGVGLVFSVYLASSLLTLFCALTLRHVKGRKPPEERAQGTRCYCCLLYSRGITGLSW